MVGSRGFNRVFGIGLSKTGITSLASALSLLGLKTKKFPRRLEDIENFDSAVDTPVAAAFQQLDHDYPSSKFVLTQRPMNEWLDSCEQMWGRRQQLFDADPYITGLHIRIYGSARFSSDSFRTAYEAHERRVRSYFRDRTEDLLEIDIFQSLDPWSDICSFLMMDRVSLPFPRDNSRAAIEALMVHVYRAVGDKLGPVLTLASAEILAELAQKYAGIQDLSSRFSRTEPSWEAQAILRASVNHFGSIGNASDALGLPKEFFHAESAQQCKIKGAG